MAFTGKLGTLASLLGRIVLGSVGSEPVLERDVPVSVALLLARSAVVTSSTALNQSKAITIATTVSASSVITISIGVESALWQVHSNNISTETSLQQTIVKTVGSDVSLNQIRTRTVTDDVALEQTKSIGIAVDITLSATVSRIIASTTSVDGGNVKARVLSASVTLVLESYRTVNTSVTLLAENERVVDSTSSLGSTCITTILAGVSVGAELHSTVTTTIALLTEGIRTIESNTTAVTFAYERTIEVTTYLSGTSTRTIVTSIGLNGTISRTIDTVRVALEIYVPEYRIEMNNDLFYVDGIEYKLDNVTGTWSTNISLKEVTNPPFPQYIVDDFEWPSIGRLGTETFVYAKARVRMISYHMHFIDGHWIYHTDELDSYNGDHCNISYMNIGAKCLVVNHSKDGIRWSGWEVIGVLEYPGDENYPYNYEYDDDATTWAEWFNDPYTYGFINGFEGGPKSGDGRGDFWLPNYVAPRILQEENQLVMVFGTQFSQLGDAYIWIMSSEDGLHWSNRKLLGLQSEMFESMPARDTSHMPLMETVDSYGFAEIRLMRIFKDNEGYYNVCFGSHVGRIYGGHGYAYGVIRSLDLIDWSDTDRLWTDHISSHIQPPECNKLYIFEEWGISNTPGREACVRTAADMSMPAGYRPIFYTGEQPRRPFYCSYQSVEYSGYAIMASGHSQEGTVENRYWAPLTVGYFEGQPIVITSLYDYQRRATELPCPQLGDPPLLCGNLTGIYTYMPMLAYLVDDRTDAVGNLGGLLCRLDPTIVTTTCDEDITDVYGGEPCEPHLSWQVSSTGHPYPFTRACYFFLAHGRVYLPDTAVKGYAYVSMYQRVSYFDQYWNISPTDMGRGHKGYPLYSAPPPPGPDSYLYGGLQPSGMIEIPVEHGQAGLWSPTYFNVTEIPDGKVGFTGTYGCGFENIVEDPWGIWNGSYPAPDPLLNIGSGIRTSRNLVFQPGQHPVTLNVYTGFVWAKITNPGIIPEEPQFGDDPVSDTILEVVLNWNNVEII